MKNRKTPTKEQQKVIDTDGLFVVQACPGSGKTFAVAARVARKLQDWGTRNRSGMAVLSFTNAAWKQVHKQLAEDFGIETGLRYPHFLGTIDSFVNRHIFLPFGQLAMKCDGRPDLVGEPFGPWHGHNYCQKQFTNLRYDIKGELRVIDAMQIGGGQSGITVAMRSAKESLNKRGFATQNDADYFAMKVLERLPLIAKSLAMRFPVVMVDEAQDSSDIQMRILDLLVQHGVKDMMLVGDPDQAIFEWRDANPRLLTEKAERPPWNEKSCRLTNNRRSSQKICDFTWRLTGRDGTPNSTSEYRECVACPEIWEHDGQDFGDLIARFLGLCLTHGVVPDRESVAVLTRSRGFLKHIAGLPTTVGGPVPWSDPVTGELLRMKALSEAHRYSDAWKLARRIVARAILGADTVSGQALREAERKHGLVALRRLAHSLVTVLPKACGPLDQWCSDAGPQWEAFCKLRNPEAAVAAPQPKKRKVHRQADVAVALAPEECPQLPTAYRLGTVHSAKGQTLDAVLLVLKQKPGNAKYYATLLKEGKTTFDEEELRIPYVAMTRPRRVLVVAAPKEDQQVWRDRLNPPVSGQV